MIASEAFRNDEDDSEQIALRFIFANHPSQHMDICGISLIIRNMKAVRKAIKLWKKLLLGN